MISRIVISLLLIISAGVSAKSPSQEVAEKSCREHPQLIGKCFVVRGRLSVYNGAPALRLWRIGTRRVLGISEQRFKVPGYRNLPESLARQLNGDNEVRGDFLVCPFTRVRSHVMQLVCVESARNLSVQKRNQQ